MSHRRRQSSLPQELTRANVDGVGFAHGFTNQNPSQGLPVVAPANPSTPPALTDFRQHRFNSRSYYVGTDVQVIAGANELRRFLAFQNNGAGTVYLAFGIPANVSGQDSFILPVNGYLSFEFGIVPNNEIYAVSGSSVQITIIEGSI